MKNKSYQEKFNELLYKKKIIIDIRPSWVAEKDNFNFIHPLLLQSNMDPHKLLKFLKHSNTLEVKITSKKPIEYRVYYSGTITNDHGDIIEFKDVDNRFCINIG